METENKIGRGKRSYQKLGKEESTESNHEMGIFLFRRITELVIEIDGKRIEKVLNLDEETIKVLKLMGEKYEKYYVRKIVQKVGFKQK